MTASKELKYIGHHACRALWKSRSHDIIRAYLTEEKIPHFSELLKWCAAERKAYHVVTAEELESISGSVHHQGICILAKMPRTLTDAELLSSPEASQSKAAMLYLDGVENPHNIGAVVRVCAHFGIPYIAGPADRMPDLAPATARIAEGGLESVTLAYLTNAQRTLGELKKNGFSVVSTSSHEGESLYRYAMPKKALFVLGGEVTGVTKAVADTADQVIRVPGTGQVESLNISVACGVISGEYWRQIRSNPRRRRKR